jgi:uncharacterized protein (TIGR03083 family)
MKAHEMRLEMSDNASTWARIHAERKAIADTIEALTPEQWDAPSLCQGWTIGFLAAHVLAGAEQTQGHFMSGMAASGFRFNTFMKRDARDRSHLTAQQIAERLRLRTTTTNHPPAPVVAMLGEVVVHGEDIRRPFGLERAVPAGAADECLDMYVKANFPVGGKKRIQGLRLRATDTGWTYGAGPEVTGRALSLMLAMTGRLAGLDGLTGEGASILAGRVSGQAR